MECPYYGTRAVKDGTAGKSALPRIMCINLAH